nr:MAG TPA: hypothetical protein [Caudoviricetes sp.]
MRPAPGGTLVDVGVSPELRPASTAHLFRGSHDDACSN